jgi:glutamyl/glutaminyl-tRNA synthetase
MSLILAPDDKSKLSKRHGATSVGEFWCALLTRTLSASDVDAGLGRKFLTWLSLDCAMKLRSICSLAGLNTVQGIVAPVVLEDYRSTL